MKCASDQRSFGFRVGHCHVQLTGVNIYIKLQSTHNGERKIKGAKSRTLPAILYKNNRDDYWVWAEKSIGYLKGKVISNQLSAKFFNEVFYICSLLD